MHHLLTVNDLTTGGQLTLPFPADARVARVKEEVAALTKLPVAEQSWSGWPRYVTDQVRGIGEFVTYSECSGERDKGTVIHRERGQWRCHKSGERNRDAITNWERGTKTLSYTR